MKKYFQLISTILAIFITALFLLLAIWLYAAQVLPKIQKRNAESAAADEKWTQQQANAGLVKDGFDVATGLIADTHYQLVKKYCTRCHSPKLITQNHADRAEWKKIIVWMQNTQNLGNLGKDEALILDYLSKNYGYVKRARRQSLKNINWYFLNLKVVDK